MLAVGLYLALIVAPPDYQQGEAVRIMYVHVPAAWMALIGLSVRRGRQRRRPGLAPSAGRDRGARRRRRSAPAFTFVCLATGSLWGRPMWGTWWVWDARLTSVLVLFFLYLGYIALVNGFDDPVRGGRAGSLLALVGVVNLPIIKFSVDWWNTLHQPASVLRFGKPTIALSMLVPLLVMALGFYAAVPEPADGAHAHRAERAQGAGLAPQRRAGVAAKRASAPRRAVAAPGAGD